MHSPTDGPYDAGFFEGQMDGSRRSAAKIAPLITEVLAPSSVVDVGGGVGPWARAFRDLGVQRTLCVDGDYVERDLLLIPQEDFLARDLTRPLALDEQFDLAISLEVAEHLPPSSDRQFVTELVSLAPAVLFSAAIPNQGGVDHLNERWQSHWLNLFAEHDYEPFDVVRPRVWDDDEVMPWYAQNMFLYVNPVLRGSMQQLKSGWPVDIVAPRFYEYQRHFIEQTPTPGDAATQLIRSLGDWARSSAADARAGLRRRRRG